VPVDVFGDGDAADAVRANIAVICSADTGQGARGTEELLSALRRFAHRNKLPLANPCVCGVRVRGLTHGTSATARDG
jgi:hypothetical protein